MPWLFGSDLSAGYFLSERRRHVPAHTDHRLPIGTDEAGREIGKNGSGDLGDVLHHTIAKEDGR